LRQVGFSCDFCDPFVNTIRNVAQIANDFAALFKTEFFNGIGQNLPLANGLCAPQAIAQMLVFKVLGGAAFNPSQTFAKLFYWAASGQPPDKMLNDGY